MKKIKLFLKENFKFYQIFSNLFKAFFKNIIIQIKRTYLGEVNYNIYQILQQFKILSKKSDEDLNNFNTNFLDEKLEKIILNYAQNQPHKFHNLAVNNDNPPKIALAFTVIYEMGGHSRLIENFAKIAKDFYGLKLFATQINLSSLNLSKNQTQNYIKSLELSGVNTKFKFEDYCKLISNFYQKIINYNPKFLLVYGNSEDVVLYGALALIKKYTKIKIFYVNIQDHLLNLGYKFADLILDFRPAGIYLTQEIRGYKNYVQMPIAHKFLADINLFSAEKILELKNSLAIADNDFVSLSGAHEDKFFTQNSSPYFVMIKKLLAMEPRLKHIVMTSINKNKNREIFNEIFENETELLKRLIILPQSIEFKKYFQMADVFIDSFPQGGALTHIDLMMLKTPTIVKKNSEKPFKSFEFYLPKNYQYIFENENEIIQGALEILANKERAKALSNQLFEHYKKNYEAKIVFEKYQTLFANSDNLSQIYQQNFYDN